MSDRATERAAAQDEYIQRLRADAQHLEKRCAQLEARCDVLAGEARTWFGTACKAVVTIDRLERDNARLAGDLLLDRAFDGPGALEHNPW